ncbi:MAG: c-type cytochrome [Maricaulaceae bacterium]
MGRLRAGAGFAALAAVSTSALAEDATLSGESLYLRHCAACHQVDGSGSPDFAPAVDGSTVLAAPVDAVVTYLETGSDSGAYINKMPGFSYLDPAELTRIAQYAVHAFAPETD